MAKVERFEDLICWQKARLLVKEIYKMTSEGRLARDYKLRDQMRSAAVSSMSNIAEGFARYHKRDFIRFLDISQSSAAEVKSLTYVVVDQGLISNSRIEEIQKSVDEIRKMVLGLIKHIDHTTPKPDSVRENIPAYGSAAEWHLPDEFLTIENAPRC